MFKINLGFLLGITHVIKNDPKDKDSSVKSSGKNKKSINVNPDNAGLKDHIIQVIKPLGQFNIEYKLLPNIKPISIDVVYWENIAKIFSPEQEFRIFKVFKNGDIMWMAIMLEHRFNNLNNEDIINLYNHKIDFNFSFNKQKLGTSAKNEKTKIFYMRLKDVTCNEEFVEAYDFDPNILNGFEERPINNSCQTKILSKEEFSLYPTISKLLFKKEEDVRAHFKDYIQLASKQNPLFTDKNPKKLKQNKGKEKKNTKKPKNLSLEVSGEILFTDPLISIHSLKNTNDKLCKAFLVISVDNLLSKEQRVIFKPFVIKILKIKNLPDEILKQERFNKVYLQYDIPHVAKTYTLEKPLANHIHINESHAYLELSLDYYLQFLQSEKLVIELIGLRTPEESQKIDSNLQNKELLAVASFDLSLLLRPVQTMQLFTIFKNPNNIFGRKPGNLQRPITPNIINFPYGKIEENSSPLSNYILLSHGTSLTIETCVSTPVYGVNELLLRSDLFKRMFLIIYNEEVAKIILSEVLLNNKNYNFEMSYIKLQKEDRDWFDVITGFLVDNGDSFIFFLEAGVDNYCFTLIWSQVKEFNDSTCNVFVNTDCTFSSRLYEDFLDTGGLLKITLGTRLQDIFKIQHVYLKNNVPEPCFYGLEKLQLLLQTQNFKEMNNSCLFPSTAELLSLNLEFGVSHKLV